jgi:hypothetical protein
MSYPFQLFLFHPGPRTKEMQDPALIFFSKNTMIILKTYFKTRILFIFHARDPPNKFMWIFELDNSASDPCDVRSQTESLMIHTNTRSHIPVRHSMLKAVSPASVKLTCGMRLPIR